MAKTSSMKDILPAFPEENIGMEISTFYKEKTKKGVYPWTI